ncbi:DUF2142 domain-containing protein [Motilibacter deserti]|uniref:DUF2142 domain-containing protein n=1 Tax=Motilibacter deserti TaxID=2714956 RepID=A0ABX0GY18_9ACTN|nr:DUF2142 domain-containing protein [Motilibacter deserti]NHC14595.1 DUF2142 domain-containing protein [Motilibacter deserti]
MLALSAWTYASPAYSSPDEPAHVLNAAAVARGQVLTEQQETARGAMSVVEVPSGLATIEDYGVCEAQPNCAPGASLTGEGGSRRLTYVGRYFPPYYAVLGLPSLVVPTDAALYTMRLLNAALCALLLALAFVHASRVSRWTVVGVLLGLTPTTLFTAATVNPNGLEISAAAAFWAGLLALGARAETPTWLLVTTGAAGVTLAVTRSLGPLWLALIALLVIAIRPRRWLDLARDRRVQVTAAVVATTAAVASLWVLLAGSLRLVGIAPPDTPLSVVVRGVVKRSASRLEQLVEVLGWLDLHVSRPLTALWLLLVAALCVAALTIPRHARRALLPVAACALLIVMLPLLEVASYSRIGPSWQGRYTLPIAVGLPIMAATLAGMRPHRLRLPLAVGAVASVCALEVAFLALSLRDYTGLRSPGVPVWEPPVPAPLLVLVCAVGLAALAAALLRELRAGRDLAVEALRPRADAREVSDDPREPAPA